MRSEAIEQLFLLTLLKTVKRAHVVTIANVAVHPTFRVIELLDGFVVGAVLVVVNEEKKSVQFCTVNANLVQNLVPRVTLSEDELLKRFKPT